MNFITKAAPPNFFLTKTYPRSNEIIAGNSNYVEVVLLYRIIHLEVELLDSVVFTLVSGNHQALKKQFQRQS